MNILNEEIRNRLNISTISEQVFQRHWQSVGHLILKWLQQAPKDNEDHSNLCPGRKEAWHTNNDVQWCGDEPWRRDMWWALSHGVEWKWLQFPNNFLQLYTIEVVKENLTMTKWDLEQHLATRLPATVVILIGWFDNRKSIEKKSGR